MTRSELTKRADEVFSRYVRQRGERSGYNECFTCGRSYEWQVLEAGHFMARRYKNTRWHPVNVWPQCQQCNRVKHGNLEVYEQKLRAMFGDAAIDELMWFARCSYKTTDEDIERVIITYRAPR